MERGGLEGMGAGEILDGERRQRGWRRGAGEMLDRERRVSALHVGPVIVCIVL